MLNMTSLFLGRQQEQSLKLKSLKVSSFFLIMMNIYPIIDPTMLIFVYRFLLQMKHSAAQVPTVAVMGEASGPPRYPPVRFRSSVHPAPSLPPLNTKQTSLVGVKVEVR